MLKIWQLQEAKNKFSQVVNEALVKGPVLATYPIRHVSWELKLRLEQCRKWPYSSTYGEAPLFTGPGWED